MPELPEVETTRRGLEPLILNKIIENIAVRNARLRWPIPDTISAIKNQTITRIDRRGKYLILELNNDLHLIVHLGMSGSIGVLNKSTPLKKHDHFVIYFKDNAVLRFNDPRRFGCILLTDDNPLTHPLLASLGPEPLSHDFNAQWLKQKANSRMVAVKNFIMNAQVVVGVGNIYASEALFKAGIHPKRAASRISLRRYGFLVQAIKDVLHDAIRSGGTTLRDFSQSDGKPGYFQQQLNVYGRVNQACVMCSHPIKKTCIGQRSSYYCPKCQH